MPRSRFRELHEYFTRLARRVHALSPRTRGLLMTERVDYSPLQGERTFGWPIMAAHVQLKMEVSRHVLEQMVVAGTHMVPFGTGALWPGAKEEEPEGMTPAVVSGSDGETRTVVLPDGQTFTFEDPLWFMAVNRDEDS